MVYISPFNILCVILLSLDFLFHKNNSYKLCMQTISYLNLM